MLGWIVTRVSNKSVSNLASERLWQPMGAEQDAYMTVDGTGVPFAGGGLSAGLRDMGRLGILVLQEGVIDGKRLFPSAAVQALRAGDDPKKFGTEHPALIGGSYTGLWWIFRQRQHHRGTGRSRPDDLRRFQCGHGSRPVRVSAPGLQRL